MRLSISRIESRFNAMLRRNEIRDTLTDMDCLEHDLRTVIKNCKSLSGPQKMAVVKKFVERMKEEKTEKTKRLQEKLVATEEETDTLKSISFFNLI